MGDFSMLKQEKQRLNVYIKPETHKKLTEYVKDNRPFFTQLNKGTIVELGLILFFEELEKRPLEELMMEYLSEK